jgi:hypothetical protein
VILKVSQLERVLPFPISASTCAFTWSPTSRSDSSASRFQDKISLATGHAYEKFATYLARTADMNYG